MPRDAGTSLDRAVMTRIYLTDFDEYAVVNAKYARRFAPTRRRHLVLDDGERRQ